MLRNVLPACSRLPYEWTPRNRRGGFRRAIVNRFPKLKTGITWNGFDVRCNDRKSTNNIIRFVTNHEYRRYCSIQAPGFQLIFSFLILGNRFII